MDPLKIVIPMLVVAGIFLALIIIVVIPDILSAFIKSKFWFDTQQTILETIDGYHGILFGCKCENCYWNTQSDFCLQNMPGVEKKQKKPHCPKFNKRRK